MSEPSVVNKIKAQKSKEEISQDTSSLKHILPYLYSSGIEVVILTESLFFFRFGNVNINFLNLIVDYGFGGAFIQIVMLLK